MAYEGLWGGSVLRTTLHSAFSFVRSVESNKALSSVTLDHLIREQIAFLKKDSSRDIVDGQGESIGGRPSRWDRIDWLERVLTLAIQTIEDAGNDSEKLKSVGIYEVDMDKDTDPEGNLLI